MGGRGIADEADEIEIDETWKAFQRRSANPAPRSRAQARVSDKNDEVTQEVKLEEEEGRKEGLLLFTLPTYNDICGREESAAGE